jgi:two-component system, OmpR family, response regulator
MRLLLIEDDVLLAEGLRDYLRSQGHVVDWCSTLAQTVALRGEPFDAWLVDWQLPDGSGVQWVKSLRERGDGTPALMLTARDQLADRIAGLDAGLDDYLVKPFAPEELAARLRAVSRRSAAPTAGQHVVGDVRIDLTARAAYVNEQLVVLTAREWAVLEALTLRAGRIVSRADLERLITGFESELASNAVEVHISALRRKLPRTLIHTVRGLGYRLGGA